MPDPVIAFAERLLSVLDDGHFVSTYKYALLLALIDVSMEQVDPDGRAPTEIATADLARRVIELYWPHTLHYEPDAQDGLPAPQHGSTVILHQNAQGGQAEILTRILGFRNSLKGNASSITRGRQLNGRGYETLARFVEWKLADQPIPRLQYVQGSDAPFLYELGWTRPTTKKAFEADGVDRHVRLRPGVGDHLVAFSRLFRPFITTEWTNRVAAYKRNLPILGQARRLDRHLFGAQRQPPGPLRRGLHELQDGACFYCRKRIVSASEIDHFIPWSRTGDDGIHNLILACKQCNQSKTNLLAAGDHVARWCARVVPASETRSRLDTLAIEFTWEAHASRTLGTARAVYLSLPSDLPLWRTPHEVTAFGADAALIRECLAGSAHQPG